MTAWDEWTVMLMAFGLGPRVFPLLICFFVPPS